VIPCHRVVGADGTLTGYGGGLWRKRFLLDLERNSVGTDSLPPFRQATQQVPESGAVLVS
jgi:alkylated DNA nucleotide flippase Atl1